MELTEQQRKFFKNAIESKDVEKFFLDVWWPMYDFWRDSEELPEIGNNPHVSTLVFALAGYPLAVRNGFEEMKNDLDGVIEKLSGGEVQSPWMP